MVLTHDRERTVDIAMLSGWSLEDYTEWKTPIPRVYVSYDSTYRTFFKQQNYRNAEQITGCPG